MKYYELTYLISPDSLEEEVKDFQEKINSLIQTEEGILEQGVKPAKKKLGYQIKKKSEAFLGIQDFRLNPEKLGALEKKLKKEKKLLRYMILAKPRTREVLVRGKKVPRKPIRKPIKVKKEEKVELKDIEKKLEEILGE